MRRDEPGIGVMTNAGSGRAGEGANGPSRTLAPSPESMSVCLRAVHLVR